MNLLNRLLRDPGVIHDWRVEDWNRFLPQARQARLLGRCYHLFEQHGLLEQVPGRLVDQLRGALLQTRYVQVQALRELRQVCRVLGREGIPVMALKGVAYLAGSLPPGGWRNLADVDLLVPEAEIQRAEQALKAAGWVPNGEFDSYDQRYYRDWMHEVPPLVHHSRETEVDIHHNLAPPVSRVRIDAARLWDESVEVVDPNGQSVRVLGPSDMLLHNAVHLFMNDELRGGLRDVVDFRDLFVHFSQQDARFEQHLLARAEELGCMRPLYYAVITARRLAGLPVSAETLVAMNHHAPLFPVRKLMSWLIEQVLSPHRLGAWQTSLADRLLFIRSHWVRMPPGLLMRHLLHKSLRSKGRPVTPEPDLPG